MFLYQDPAPFVPITFMGDIDGDKKMGLIINSSNHFSLTRQVLFLTKPVNPNENVKTIGKFDKYCC